MDAMYSVVRFFVTGGAFMYPILIVFAVGTAIAVERYLTLRRIRSKNEATWNRLQPTLA
jgi:biopolymer transport protein ExbB